MKQLLVALFGIVGIVLISGCVSVSAEEQCVNSGGTVTNAHCCLQTGDFPNTCLKGPCGCSPDNSHDVKICDCGERCWDGTACAAG